MTELRKTFVVYLMDIDPDTGDVAQMKPVAYTELEVYADEIAKFLTGDDGDEPNRTYKYTKLW